MNKVSISDEQRDELELRLITNLGLDESEIPQIYLEPIIEEIPILVEPAPKKSGKTKKYNSKYKPLFGKSKWAGSISRSRVNNKNQKRVITHKKKPR